MVRRRSLFVIFVINIITNAADVRSGVLVRSLQNSAANSIFTFYPYTLDRPHPFSFPQEMPYSPYTSFTGPEPNHEPEPQPQPEQAYRSQQFEHNHESDPQRARQSESHVERARQFESHFARGSETVTPLLSERQSEAHPSPGRDRPRIRQHLIHRNQTSWHALPHRHVRRRIRLRMPARTPMSVRRLFTLLNSRITKDLIPFRFENLHLVRKKTPLDNLIPAGILPI